MKNLIFFLIVVLSFTVKAQNADIHGKVVDLVTGKPIANVQVELFKRKITIQPDGVPHMHPVNQAISLNLSKYTNADGVFQFEHLESNINDIYIVNLSVSGYEEMQDGLVYVQKNTTSNVNYELVKTNPSDADQKIIEQKYEEQHTLKNQIKYSDTTTDIKPSQKKSEPVGAPRGSCTTTIPTSVYVQNLYNGYNNTSCSNSGFFTGTMDFDEYIAGVVRGEMNGFPLEAMKAQAVAARTYSLRRHNSGLSVNCGQAYSSTSCTNCTSASNTTTGQVMLYNNSVINASYAARCNGNYTQNANEGTWNPASNCNRSGTSTPYLISKPCSGHSNCSSTSETPCCNVTISTANTSGYIYGHGVGLCQRGAQGFANQGYIYTTILNNFYTGICLTSSSPPPSLACNNDNSCTPMSLAINASCVNSSCSTVGATGTQSINFNGGSSCATLYQSTRYDDDVWFTISPTSTNPVTIKVTPTSNTANFDVVVGVYQGTCSSLTQLSCADVNSAGVAENLVFTPPSTGTYYVRVFSYGIGSTYAGNFNICATSTAATCTDQFEPNNSSGAATNVFQNPLSSNSSNYTLPATMGYAGDQDWYRVNIQACGTLTVNLSGLPSNYDLELWNASASTALDGSYSSGSTGEQVTFTSSSATLTNVYVKVYANPSSSFSTASCHNLQFLWSPATCACTPPSAPTLTFGSSSCPGTASTNIFPPGTTLDWNSVSGATDYIVSVSEYPYGTGNLLSGYNPYPCGTISGTQLVMSAALQPGKLYRWNIYATSNCGNSSCSSPVSSTRYFHIPPAITSSGSNTICQGLSKTLSINPIPTPGSGSSLSYQWYNNGNIISGATSSSYSATATGSYTVKLTYTGSSACSSATTDPSNSISVTVNPLPSPPSSITTTGSSYCAGQSPITLTANGSLSSGADWEWYEGGCAGNHIGSGQSIQVSPGSTTTYYVNAENSCGTSACANTAITVVSQPAAPAPAASHTQLCEGQPIELFPGGSGSAYSWTGPNGYTSGQSNPIVQNATTSSGGQYCLVVTQNGCQSQQGCIYITVDPALSVSISGNSSPYCVGNQASLSASGSTSYTWSGQSVNGLTGSSVNPIFSTAGTYVLTVTGTTGVCTATATTQVVVGNAVAPTVSITQTTPGPICSGDAVTFTASVSNGGNSPSYDWYVNGSLQPDHNPTFTVSSAVSGIQVYAKVVSNAQCATTTPVQSNTLTIQTSAPVAPAVTMSASNTQICTGDNVTFTATPTHGGASASYTWYVNGSPQSGSSQLMLNNVTANTTVYVEMTSSLTCVAQSTATAATVNVQVTSQGTPGVSITASSSSAECAGVPITFTAVPVNGGSSPLYQWKINGNNTGGNTPSATFTSSSLNSNDVITVMLTSNSTCVVTPTASSNAVAVAITPTVLPTVAISRNPSGSLCTGDNVTFSAAVTNEGPQPVYVWKVNGNAVGGNSATYSSTTLSNNDVVSVSLTSNELCASPATVSASATMVIQTIITPAVSISSNASGAVCINSNITFTATATNGGNAPMYQWLLNGVPVGGNSSTYSSSSLADGDELVVLLTSNAPCVTAATVVSLPLTVSLSTTLQPSVTISTNATWPACSNAAFVFTANATNEGPNPTYTWKVNGTAAGTSPTFTPTTLANNDMITCELTSSLSCAVPATVASSPITAIISQSVVPTGVVSTPQPTVCSGNDVTFSAAITNGGSAPVYQWKKNGNNVGTNSFTYIDTNLTTSDVITLELTSNATCANPPTVTSGGTSVMVNPSPSVVLDPPGPLTICQGDSVYVTAPVGYPTYHWSSGAATAGTYVKFIGPYAVTVTGVNGCTAVSDLLEVSVLNAPAAPIITTNGSGLTSTTGTTYEWYHNGVAIPNATGQNLANLGGGDYYVVITDQNGCKSQSAVYTYVVDVGLEEIAGFDLDVYPNPATYEVVIRSDYFLKNTMNVTLHDVAGKRIAVNIKQEADRFILDISALSSGTYNVVIAGSNEQISRKFIKITK